MARKLIKTKDGSHTLFLEELNEHYHSIHGAMQESKHVFVEEGLKKTRAQPIRLLEVGFGTGLNAILSCLECEKTNVFIDYTALEKYPLILDIVSQLNYYEFLSNASDNNLFYKLHEAEWDKPTDITPNFRISKIETDFEGYEITGDFDLIYFDAFAPDKQPEMWSQKNFEKLYRSMNENGILVTYSAKGVIKRRLESIGFKVEKIPGPPGKREMIRAIRE